ncbi:MAG: hypothetical protein P1P88_10040 [Bacteroidales bacterium]|nr:hypothetical protein [Bacteroidales bacterium]
MTNIHKILGAILFGSITIFGCGNNNQPKESTDSASIQRTILQQSNDFKIVTAKFIEGGALEAEADLIFEKEDGSKIVFYRNYMDPEEPEIKINFISEDGITANKELLGQTFNIKYKERPQGRVSLKTGEAESCNQILSIEKK